MTRPVHLERVDSIFVANIESERRPPLGQFLAGREHAVVLLQQANRLDAKHDGYREVGFRFSFEARGIKALVRDDVRVIRRKAIIMRRRWIGPKAGKGHEPRVYLALLVEIDGLRMWVVDVHLPTRNSAKAQAESLRRLRRWVARRRKPVFVGGDFNLPEAEVTAWANRIGAATSVLGSVDYAVTRGLRVQRVDRRLAPRAPFHGWGCVKFDTRESR